MNLGSISFAAVPVLLSLYKYCKPKTIAAPEPDYDFIIVGGASSLLLPLSYLTHSLLVRLQAARLGVLWHQD
jgi:hypothetical protein